MQHLDQSQVVEVEPSGRGGGGRSPGQPQAVHVRHRRQHQTLLARGRVQQLDLLLHKERQGDQSREKENSTGEESRIRVELQAYHTRMPAPAGRRHDPTRDRQDE